MRDFNSVYRASISKPITLDLDIYPLRVLRLSPEGKWGEVSPQSVIPQF